MLKAIYALVHEVILNRREMKNLGETLVRIERKIMATFEEVKNAFTALNGRIVVEGQQAKAAFTVLEDQITALKAQIAEGTAATPAQLDELLTLAGSVGSGIDSIITINEPSPTSLEGDKGPGADGEVNTPGV